MKRYNTLVLNLTLYHGDRKPYNKLVVNSDDSDITRVFKEIEGKPIENQYSLIMLVGSYGYRLATSSYVGDTYEMIFQKEVGVDVEI